MTARSWMQMPEAPRAKVRRTPGRRASDQRPKLVTVLTAAVLLAWAWGIYEVALALLR
jgi:hypothetical protein